jgi:polysaccharide pyruvyl transferase WcaK-like protein
MANKFFLYGHNGSGNHGCEALVRSTAKILKINYPDANVTLASNCSNEDFRYGLNSVVDIIEEKNRVGKLTFPYIKAYLDIKLFNNRLKSEELNYRKTFYNIDKETLCLSIGGDNYCYPGYQRFIMLHNMVMKKKHKTILWGCSVEPSKIDDEMAQDFRNYDLIIARETLTFKALKSVGANVKLYPDPAFQLNKIDKTLPEGFIDGNTIGINISPMIVKNEQQNGITVRNYELLIKHIIEDTDMNVALIPHVIWEDNNDDRIPCKDLYDKFKHTGRIVMIEDDNCEVLKGYISRCRMFIGARTHATIAAYSTCVPTLVMGYSIKAKGIAKDLFGTYDNYVVPVQNLQDANTISIAFQWLMNNEQNIKLQLQEIMPKYKERVRIARQKIEELI